MNKEENLSGFWKVLEKIMTSGIKIEDIHVMLRMIGSDVAIGELVLKKGERIGPAEVGLLATVGRIFFECK
jgi:hypothetical protein